MPRSILITCDKVIVQMLKHWVPVEVVEGFNEWFYHIAIIPNDQLVKKQLLVMMVLEFSHEDRELLKRAF